MSENVIECNVWCSESDANADLGLPTGDCWMPYAIDLRCVSAIKLCGPNEFLGDDKATLYFHGIHVTIDIAFVDAVKIWKEILKKETCQK
jgi:hypothetical protein